MRIFQNRPRPYTCEGVTLKPGPNDVSDEAAKVFLAHIAVKNLIKIGHITVEADTKSKLENGK